MTETMTAPRTRRSGATSRPTPPPPADEADWLKSPETRAAMAACEDALAHPEKHTWHTSLHELFADLYS